MEWVSLCVGLDSWVCSLWDVRVEEAGGVLHEMYDDRLC